MGMLVIVIINQVTQVHVIILYMYTVHAHSTCTDYSSRLSVRLHLHVVG